MLAACQRFATRTPVFVQRMEFSNKFNEKEMAEEAVFFSKQDASALKNLMKKLEAREKMAPKAQQHDAICDDLDTIFSSHGLKKDADHKLLYQELMEWKRHRH